MSERNKTLLLKYGITGGVCLLMVAAHLIGANVLELKGADLVRVLSDAFTVPGLLCIFSGLMIWLGNEGTFDGVGYVLSYAFHALLPGPWNKRESYKEYLERKSGRKPLGYSFLLITGAVFLAVSLVFTVLFHMQ